MRKIYVIIITIFLTFAIDISAQVAINTDGSSADGTAILDVKSTSQGLLIPRMTTSDRTGITTPANGLLVFDTDTKSVWFYELTSASWKEIYGSNNNTTLADADGDTKVEVEQTADDDAISFTMNNTKFIVFDSARIEILNSGSSVFIGENAGKNDDYSGNSNVAIGKSALEDNIYGGFNTAMGTNTLKRLVAKSGNTAIGYGSMSFFDNSTSLLSSYNTAVGMNSLVGSGTASNNTGQYNIAVGAFSLNDNTSGSDNVAVGYSSLSNNTSGSDNIAIGRDAMKLNNSNSRSTAIGYDAMYYADNRTTGRDTYNTALGYEALKGSSSASANFGRYNTAIGDNAMMSNTSGDNNIAVGGSAMKNNAAGDYNTAVGQNTLYSNVGNDRTTAIGYQAMYYADSRTPGQNTYNTALGFEALKGSTLASSNTGRFNTAIGDASMQVNTTGDNNVAVGYFTLKSNQSGENNTGIGSSSLTSTTTGSHNSAFGYRSMYWNSSGNYNTAMGYSSLFNISTGSDQNTSIGYFSLVALMSGDMNVAIGDRAGDNLSSGSNNIFIGHDTDAPIASGSNQLNIGNIIYGTGIDLSNYKIGIGIDAPDEALDVRGNFQVKQSASAVTANIESSTAAATLFIKSSGSNLGQITFFDNSVYGASFGYSNVNDRIFLWHGNNNIYFEDGTILPGDHKSGDLGADGQAWDDIYYDDLHNQGAAAFANRIVTEEIINHPPKEKTEGSFDYSTERGDVELDPLSLPDALHDENSILTDEVVTYNYKANYEQQLQINEMKETIEQQNEKIEQLLKLLTEK